MAPNVDAEPRDEACQGARLDPSLEAAANSRGFQPPSTSVPEWRPTAWRLEHNGVCHDIGTRRHLTSALVSDSEPERSTHVFLIAALRPRFNETARRWPPQRLAMGNSTANKCFWCLVHRDVVIQDLTPSLAVAGDPVACRLHDRSMLFYSRLPASPVMLFPRLFAIQRIPKDGPDSGRSFLRAGSRFRIRRSARNGRGLPR